MSKARGFTLIEVLVALAITSMVVSVLMSALFYAAKVQSAIRQELVERDYALQAKAWFSETLGSCLPADPDSGAGFLGSAHEISCDTLMPLQGKKYITAQRIYLSLRSSGSQSQQLIYRQTGSTAQSYEQLITTLPNGTATFSYIDIQGQELDIWPKTAKDPETLPRRVRLLVRPTMSSQIKLEWIASLGASPWLEPVLTNPFGVQLKK